MRHRERGEGASSTLNASSSAFGLSQPSSSNASPPLSPQLSTSASRSPSPISLR
eukprot:CAMPEP_0174749144 /NCGR_PEP_ID=MMETSP1094-20130205/95074_1 /TAXON_ID=156173 /ORGANISM="Chrysochromulina brevifilum, Strain UTEX LB 985" /LENGTH=53 /DNA_ID=CAMNT_0015954311 /DNA_START=238 /DNA_END=396 /DNA_ORIENTATION=+